MRGLGFRVWGYNIGLRVGLRGSGSFDYYPNFLGGSLQTTAQVFEPEDLKLVCIQSAQDLEQRDLKPAGISEAGVGRKICLVFIFAMMQIVTVRP